ncbi:MAG: hypothetical protein LBR53_12030 [Deltaproteobacteria bacterium]|jgi:hypothetical protein|nr:hypothetical protein [Deltaproteobacteria bacterium]
MRVITLDELTPDEINKLRDYIEKIAVSSSLEDLYWYYLPYEILSEKQKQLNSEKGPYKISIEIARNYIKFELVVRADMIHNEGGGIVTINQLIHIYQLIDKMADDLNLTTCK